MNKNNKILYETEEKEFYKSGDAIYFKKENEIVIHNIYNNTERIIKSNLINDATRELDYNDMDKLIEKYKYYYIDNDGKMNVFENKKYGIEIESNGISVYRWYDKQKTVYQFEKILLEDLISLGEIENKKDKLICGKTKKLG